MKVNYKARVTVLFIAICATLVLVTGKLYMVQVVHGDQYSERADHQYVRPNQNLYNRGAIYFQSRTGEKVPAATLKSGYVAAINPEQITDPQKLHRRLSS